MGFIQSLEDWVAGKSGELLRESHVDLVFKTGREGAMEVGGGGGRGGEEEGGGETENITYSYTH